MIARLHGTGRRRPLLACIAGALALALSVGCAGPGPAPVAGDRVQDRLDEAGRAAFDAGDFEQAEALFRQSLERAYLRDDATDIADAAYSLAAAQARLRQLKPARARLVDARAALAAAGRSPWPGLLLLDAGLAYELGETGTALALVQDGLAAGPEPDVAAALHLLAGSIACEGGDTAAASAALARARQLAAADTSAAYQRLEGCLALARGDPGAAAAAFDRETRALRETFRYDTMADALARAGEAYVVSGELATAADRLLRAGRSARLQGREGAAARWLERAADLAKKAGEPALAAEAARWRQR